MCFPSRELSDWRLVCLKLLLLVLPLGTLRAQFPYGDKWYQNPLGFEPVNLHAAQGFIYPAVAAGILLLVTSKDTSLHNRLSVYTEAGPSWGYKYPYTLLTQTNVGLNYQLRRYLSVGVELSSYFPSDNFNNGFGMAVRPFFRFYPINRPRWRLWFESGGGLILFADEFPRPTDQDARLGTRLNGTTKYGLATEVHWNAQMALLFGVRHVHVSNGNRAGVERNPSHDSNGFFIGISRRW